jgi:diacylglycerol kinase (ATP)
LPRRVERALAAEGHGVTLIETGGPGTAGDLARRRIEAGSDLILALGGDGTLNDLLPGVAHSAVPLGVIPAGTANVLARETGIGCSALTAVRRLSDCVLVRVPLGVLRAQPDAQPRYFLLMAGAGIDGRIVYRMSLPLKAKMGQLAYWVSSLGVFLGRLDEFPVEVNGQSFRCSFALVSRVRNYAGYLQIAHKASLLAPDFEVVLFEGRSGPRHYLKYLASTVAGVASNVKGRSFLRASSVVFPDAEGARLHVQVDGEYAGRLPASVSIEPDAVTLLVPPDYCKRP